MKKILFSCTGCNSSYTIARHDAETLPSGVFVCRKCGKKIKLAFCPECGTSYSIGFSRQLQGSYPLKCRRCGREFQVAFETSIPQKTSHVMSAPQKRNEKEKVVIDSASEFQTPQKETRKEISKETAFSSSLAEDLFSFETIRQYFVSIFNIKKIIACAAGILALALLLIITSWAENVLQRLEFVRQIPFMLHLLNFFEIFCFAAVIVSVHATVARLTDMRGSNDEMRMRDLARFGVSRAIPLLAGVFGIIAVFNALVVLFSSIPVIGPVLYSLLFLPVYVLSIAVVILSLVAFWFYPPLLAFAEDIRASIAGFLDFIRRHHVSLLLDALVLSMIAAVFGGLLIILHSTVLSAALSLSGALLGDEFSRIVSPVSAGIGEVNNFTAFFSKISVMHHVMGELLLAHRIGGILFGTAMMLLSTAVYSVILSGTGTLSAWAYRAVESGKYPDARKIRYFLLTLTLILAVMYLFKKVFLS